MRNCACDLIDERDEAAAAAPAHAVRGWLPRAVGAAQQCPGWDDTLYVQL